MIIEIINAETGFENHAQQTLILNSSVGLQENTHHKDLKCGLNKKTNKTDVWLRMIKPNIYLIFNSTLCRNCIYH